MTRARRAFLASMLAVKVGDSIVCDGQYAAVTAVRQHAETPAGAPIRDGYLAREIVTARGSRWYGITPEEARELTS